MTDAQPVYRKPLTLTPAERKEWFAEQRRKLRKQESEPDHQEPW